MTLTLMCLLISISACPVPDVSNTVSFRDMRRGSREANSETYVGEFSVHYDGAAVKVF